MKTYIQLCISIFACISLCHGASTFTSSSEIGELNRALVKLTQYSWRMGPNDYNVSSMYAKHHVSNLEISSSCGGGISYFCVLEQDNQKKVIWDNSFADRTASNPTKVEWYDALGEQIAVRRPDRTYQLVYRISYMSLLKKLNQQQLSLLHSAILSHEQRNAPLDIHEDDIAPYYRTLPHELKLPALFNPSLAVRLHEVASAIFSCCRAYHNVRWLIVSGA